MESVIGKYKLKRYLQITILSFSKYHVIHSKIHEMYTRSVVEVFDVQN